MSRPPGAAHGWTALPATVRARPAESATLALLLAAAGLSYSWNLGYAGYSSFYSTAARSMSVSWRAFAFGAFDPGAHITLDKLSGFLVPQALSARLFGFHPWALALPQVLEGMVTVGAVYLLGRRWKGAAVGLLAAAMAVATPLFASMFGHVMEDGLLTMSMALALVCWQSALRTGRTAPLLLSGLWVAVGFQAKMLQAWVILPWLCLGLLLAGRGSRGRRVGSATLLGATAVLLSLVWMTCIQLVPARDRPYIDGTSNNNIYSMVFGFNGANRLDPGLVPGVLRGNSNTHGSTPVLSIQPPRRRTTGARIPSGREHGKLFLPYYVAEIGWLYPAAAAGLLLEAWLIGGWLSRRRRAGAPATATAGPAEPGAAARPVARLSAVPAMAEPTAIGSPVDGPAADLPAAEHAAAEQPAADLPAADGAAADGAPPDRPAPDPLSTGRESAALSLALAGWLVLDALILSYTQVPHVAYLAGIGLQLVVLAAVGVIGAARLYLRRPGAPGLALPLLLVAGAGWDVWVLLRGNVAPGALAVAAAVVGVLAAGWLLLTRRPGADRPSRPVLAAAVVAVLLVPTAWTGYVLDRSLNGTAGEAYAGPRPGSRDVQFSVSPPFAVPPDTALSPSQVGFLHYLRDHGAGQQTVLSDNWTIATSYLLSQPVRIMAMGGFSGRAPTPTLDQLQSLIGSGTVRFALLTHGYPTGGVAASVVGSNDLWIRQHCTPLDTLHLQDRMVTPVRRLDAFDCAAHS